MLNRTSLQARGLQLCYPLNTLDLGAELVRHRRANNQAYSFDQRVPQASTVKLDAIGAANFFVSNYIDTGITSLPTSPGLTVCCRANHDSAGGTEQLVSKGYDGTNTEWQLYISTAGKVVFDTYNGGSNKGVTSSASISTTYLDDIVATFDGTTWSIYLNGTLDTATAPGGSIVATARPIVIGAVDNNGSGYLQQLSGRVMDVRIYSRALTPQEARAYSQLATRWDLYAVPTWRDGLNTVSSGAKGPIFPRRPARFFRRTA